MSPPADCREALASLEPAGRNAAARLVRRGWQVEDVEDEVAQAQEHAISRHREACRASSDTDPCWLVTSRVDANWLARRAQWRLVDRHRRRVRERAQLEHVAALRSAAEGEEDQRVGHRESGGHADAVRAVMVELGAALDDTDKAVLIVRSQGYSAGEIARATHRSDALASLTPRQVAARIEYWTDRLPGLRGLVPRIEDDEFDDADNVPASLQAAGIPENDHVAHELVHLRLANRPYAEIALRLGRTEEALRQRFRRLMRDHPGLRAWFGD